MTDVHGSETDVVGNGYVLTDFLNSASQSGTRDTAESTTFKKKSKTYLPGLGDVTMSLGGIWQGDIDEADQILDAALGSGDGVITYFPYSMDAVGNLAYTLVADEGSYDINTAVGAIAQITADFAAGDAGTGMDRGVVAHPLEAEVAAGSGPTVDGKAASTNGGALIVHSVAANGLTMFMQDSADGATWADLPGSIAIAAGRSSQRLAIAGTIRRYTRVRWTGTGTFVATANRK